jgi:hypothetical protein
MSVTLILWCFGMSSALLGVAAGYFIGRSSLRYRSA